MERLESLYNKKTFKCKSEQLYLENRNIDPQINKQNEFCPLNLKFKNHVHLFTWSSRF